MKKLILAVALLLPLQAANKKWQGYCELGGQTVTTNGVASTTYVQRSYRSCTVTVYNAGTLNLSTIFSDSGGTPKANPFTADTFGFGYFWAADNTSYDIQFSGGGIASPFTRSDVFLAASSSSGITSLNALTAATQTFAVGTAGTDFAISSATSTHTFNLPTASATNRGALSSADWTTFNAKESALTFSSPLSRAVNTISLSTVPIGSGGTGNTTVTAAFNALSPLTTKGDVLAFNGTNNVRLGVGTDGYALIADSGQSTGLRWAAALATIPVTVSQGGTGITSLTGVPFGAGTSALSVAAASSQRQFLRRTPNVAITYAFADPWWMTNTDFDFPAQSPGGSLTSGIGNTVTLSPCPLGVNGADATHYLYISGGTGSAEAVLITGGTCTSGASSGTVIFTPANNHSGAWTVTSATQGIQEAVCFSPSGDNTVRVAQGTVTLNANVGACGKTNYLISKSVGVTLAGSGTMPTVNVASATTTTIGPGTYFHITGTDAITTLNTCNTSNAGRQVVLIFDGILTFTDGNNLKLAGDFTTSADDTISLVCDGTNWYEQARSAN